MGKLTLTNVANMAQSSHQKLAVPTTRDQTRIPTAIVGTTMSTMQQAIIAGPLLALSIGDIGVPAGVLIVKEKLPSTGSLCVLGMFRGKCLSSEE